jgi:hypothetical protein
MKMNEKQFIKELEEMGFKDESFNIQIYYTLDAKGNVIIDFDSIGEQIKRVEQELLEIINGEENLEKL